MQCMRSTPRPNTCCLGRRTLGIAKIKKSSFSEFSRTDTRISRHMFSTCLLKHQKQANNIDLFACTCRSVFCLYLMSTLIRISSWHESVRSHGVLNAPCKNAHWYNRRASRQNNCREVRKLGQDFFLSANNGKNSMIFWCNQKLFCPNKKGEIYKKYILVKRHFLLVASIKVETKQIYYI